MEILRMCVLMVRVLAVTLCLNYILTEFPFISKFEQVG